MHGNNEVGVIEPMAAICAVAHARGVPVHTDAVQTVGKIPFDVVDTPVDCLSMAAHKFYGPKGVGALYIRRGTTIRSRSFGGGQEGGLRAGTENVPGIVGLGAACGIALRDMAVQMGHTETLRNRLETGLMESISDARVNGGKASRLPHVLSVSFRGVEGGALVDALDHAGIAALRRSGLSCGSYPYIPCPCGHGPSRRICAGDGPFQRR